jgi:transposase
MAEISMYDPEMFLWIDETGCDKRNCTRKYGYSLRGIPPCDHRLLVRGTRYSALPIMSLQGIHDVQIVEGTVNGRGFADFVVNTLIPIFDGNNPLSVVIMDNASIHHVEDVMDLIERRAQAKIVFLPPYSPDLMPLEEAFSKVKKILMGNYKILQSSTSLRVFIAMAFGISTDNCIAYAQYLD